MAGGLDDAQRGRDRLEDNGARFHALEDQADLVLVLGAAPQLHARIHLKLGTVALVVRVELTTSGRAAARERRTLTW